MIKKFIPFIIFILIVIILIGCGKFLHRGRDKIYWILSVFSENKTKKERYLSKSLDVNSEFSYLLIDRAWAYIDLKQYDRALEDFLLFRSKYPHRIESWYGEAYVYEQTGDKQKALNIYSTAIGIEKTSLSRFPWVYEKRGNILYELGHIKEGRIDLIEFNMMTDNSEKALKLLNQWINESDTAHARELRGKIYQKKREYEKAFIDFTKVMELAPEYGWGSIYRARLNYKRKRADLAFQDLDYIIEKIPEFSEAYLQRAEYYQQNSDREKALADYQAALKIFKKYNLLEEANKTTQKITSLNSVK